MKRKVLHILEISILLGIMLGCSGCSLFKTKIDVSEYIHYSYAGIDGYTTLEMNLDCESMKNDFLGKIKKKKIESFEELLAGMKLETMKGENLCNGDEIVLAVGYDVKLADTAGVLLKNTEVQFVVEGLEEGELIDLFADVTLKIQGTAPFAFASVENNSTNQYISGLQYTVEPSIGFKRGDVLKVTCNATKETAKNYDYVYLKNEEYFATDLVDEYIMNASQIDMTTLTALVVEAKNTVIQETENSQQRMLYRLTGNTNFLFQYNKEWVDSIELQQIMFMKNEDAVGIEVPLNRLYIIFKAYVANSDYGNDGYFCFEYTNLISKADGTTSINHENEEKRYLCAKDYTTLMQEVLGKRQGNYTEESVDISSIDVQNN